MSEGLMSEATLSRQAIVQEEHQVKDWTPVKVIYAGLMVINLLSYIYLLAVGAEMSSIPTVIWFTRLASVPLAIHLGKLWKDKGFQILGIYFLWFLSRIVFDAPQNLFHEQVSQNVLNAIWVFAGCYGMGRILREKELKAFFQIIIAVWTAAILVYCGFGIYSAWTDQTINGLGQGSFRLDGEVWYRLQMIYLPTTAGSILSLSALLAIIMAATCKRIACKAAYVLSALIIIITLALTDSRSAFLSVSIGLAVLVFIRIKTWIDLKRTSKSWIGWAGGTVGMLVTFAIVFMILMRIIPAFNNLKLKGIIPVAYAEEIEDTGKELAQRGFHTSDIFSGRLGLWADILKHMTGDFTTLMIGESKLMPLQSIHPEFAHCHCLYVQVFLESGLPGLLLVCLFIASLAKNSIGLLNKTGIALWIKLLPLLPVSLLIGDIFENFIWLRTGQCPMIAALFITAGIISGQTTAGHKETKRT